MLGLKYSDAEKIQEQVAAEAGLLKATTGLKLDLAHLISPNRLEQLICQIQNGLSKLKRKQLPAVKTALEKAECEEGAEVRKLELLAWTHSSRLAKIWFR